MNEHEPQFAAIIQAGISASLEFQNDLGFLPWLEIPLIISDARAKTEVKNCR